MSYLKRDQVNRIEKKLYPFFKKINGEHPFKNQVPESMVEYKARHRKGGKVSFFNFDLAKQMGLIPKSHPSILNRDLEEEILKTFSLVIINEYDEINKIKFSDKDVLSNKYMATRYLQLQHPSKIGKTSGDGRSIWNGTLRSDGVTWDIMSCGTGATRLSPASNINNKFYKTGDPEISYGCGLSEVTEGLESLFFSEVLWRNGLKTERVLAIIEFEKGISINVRAYPNLIRPSHFFAPLKQNNYKNLKQLADYYISREIENKLWPQKKFKDESEKYFFLAQRVAQSFAQTVAKFEDEYIFCWLDWDGDNILMDGGIIDYGSVRQFGLFHAEYRFDDVDRFSTTILEQRNKARYIVQCFIQIADFLSSRKKKPLSYFKKHKILEFFDHTFYESRDKNLVERIGFNQNHQTILMNEYRSLVQKFRKPFNYFERSKSKRSLYKVADGINRDAIFCMRDILRELPQFYLSRGEFLSEVEFMEVIKSSYAKKSDLKMTPARKKYIIDFQNLYISLVDSVIKKTGVKKNQLLLELTMRSSVINKYDRITGNSIYFIVQEAQKIRPKISANDLFQIVKEFSQSQNLDPSKKFQRIANNNRQKNILQNLHAIVRECREGL